MYRRSSAPTRTLLLLLAGLMLAGTGCSYHYIRPRPSTSIGAGLTHPVPKELDKAILPEYRIEPPDVLQVTGVRLVPKTPYRLKVGDSLAIEVLGTIPDAPIRGIYPVQIGGVINLGYSYGTVTVRDMTVEEAQDAIYQHLLDHLREPTVTVSLANIATVQQIIGPRLVAQDGRINLGTYGTVSVTGLTVEDAKTRIEEQLAEFLDDPEVSVDVQAYNSKFYYIITQGAGMGDRVIRIPTSGNETVLDAISTLGGFNSFASNKIWIARPGRNRHGHDQILKVDWRAISQLGEIDTNYQLMPGDRLYVSENKWVRLDNDLRMLTRPVFTAGQFINFMLGTMRNVNFGITAAAPQAFQNIGAGGGFGGGLGGGIF